jgi:phosphoribosylanthranilate isomerase
LIAALPPSVLPVGVFVAPAEDDVKRARSAGVRIAQVYDGDAVGWDGEVWAARSLDSDLDGVPSDVTLVLDAHDPVRHGGTGRTIDWAHAAAVAARRRVLLAGGLTPVNVGAAVRHVRPFGVDVSSGIEDRPGVKNMQAMTAFVAAVREAEQ